MARPSKEFLMAWESLSATNMATGWQAIALTPAGTLELRAGRRSPDNAEAVLVGFPSMTLAHAEKLPESQGFSVERADPDDNGQVWLALTRKPAGSVELFATMVCDVVGAIDDNVASGTSESKLARIFIGRVAAWQEFMRKGTQVLSPEAEIGLVGEIIVLRAIIDAGVSSVVAIESWLGPIDGIHDFELGTGALEVKSTLSTAGFPAKIGSLEQLDDSTRQPLFVAGVKLKQAASGKTLPEIAQEMRLTLSGDPETECLLTQRLLSAGYIDAHSDRYPRQFEMHETRIVKVTNDFPRLTIGNVPLGITKTMYEIDLDKVAGEDIDFEDALKKMGAI